MTQHDFGDIASRLVRHAARHAPPQLASRLEEEWLADLSARRGLASRLCFGLGCCWARRVIAHEHGAACAAAAGTAPAQHLLHVQFDPSRWSRKTLVVIAVACVHVLLIYTFVTGLAQRVAVIISTPITGSVVEEPRKRESPPPPPLPQPQFGPPGLVDSHPIQPDFKFQVDPPTPVRVTRQPLQTNIVTAAHPPPSVTRVPGGPGAGFPDTDDYYPAIARRLGEAGTAIVRVCVDERGRLTAAPAVVRSSGSARIDAGSINLARAGSGHYRPTTENGRPVSSCYAFRATFRLKD